MGMAWKESWTEVWSSGHGPSRSYCGIAHTEEGFAVDVFHGDTCVASATFGTRHEAEQAANQMRGRYQVVVSTIGYTRSNVNPVGWVNVPRS